MLVNRQTVGFGLSLSDLVVVEMLGLLVVVLMGEWMLELQVWSSSQAALRCTSSARR